MATVRKIIAYEKVVQANRKKLKVLPDPMELARLATALKPDLAAGTREEQREAIGLARTLFDIAVDVAAKPTAAQKSGLVWGTTNSSLLRKITQEFSEGLLPYDPDGKGEDALQAYLRECRIKVPKSYNRGSWKDLLDEHGFEEAGQHQVPKKVIDDEVQRIKTKDSDRQRDKRNALADAKMRPRK